MYVYLCVDIWNCRQCYVQLYLWHDVYNSV